ncbi:MAG: hypothetical protein WDO18_09785 [Acidobacteriota bacterium]
MTTPEHRPKEGLSYLYAVYWEYKFFLRQAIVGRYAPHLLILLFLVEILGPMTHLIPVAEKGTARYLLTAGLVGTAAVMIWHHQRLHKRVTRSNNVISSVMVLMESDGFLRGKSGTKKIGVMKRKQNVADILDTFAFAVGRYYPKHIFTASLLAR